MKASTHYIKPFATLQWRNVMVFNIFWVMLVKKMPRWNYLLMKNFLSFRCSKDPGYIKTGVGSNPEVLISFWWFLQPDFNGWISKSANSYSCYFILGLAVYITQDPLLNIDLNNNSSWNGNWSQLCPTCKVSIMFYLLNINEWETDRMW